jgi:gas vesicle protein
MARNNKSGSGFAIAFILGGIIGIIAGVILAPRSGSETRRELQDIRDGWRSRAGEVAATLHSQVVPGVEQTRGRLGPTVAGVRERVTSGVEEVSALVRRHSENGIEEGGEEEKA